MQRPIHSRVAEVTDGPLATRWAGLNPEPLQGVLRAPGNFFSGFPPGAFARTFLPWDNATAKKGDRGYLADRGQGSELISRVGLRIIRSVFLKAGW